MTHLITALLTIVPANANSLDAPAASVVRQGQWTTNAAYCKGNCRSITNASYTDCVSYGFVGAMNPDNEHGKIAVVDGSGNGLGVYIPDGPDLNLLPDFVSCIPPRETVHGDVTGLGAHTREGYLEVEMTTTKYPVGNEWTHYESILLGPEYEIWGSYFKFTYEPITTVGRPGIRENWKLNQPIKAIGG
ncbi:MAG: hypothetical protein AAB776_03375 [Patescibacteria group bacterium]